MLFSYKCILNCEQCSVKNTMMLLFIITLLFIICVCVHERRQEIFLSSIFTKITM